MSLFSNTRTRRRTVFTVVLVWLFAIISGWANACVLQQRATHLHGVPDLHGSADGSFVAAQRQRVSPGHFGADTDHPENTGTAKGACLKVCGDGTQTLVKSASSVDSADVVMAPPAVLTWTVELAAAVADDSWPAFPSPSQRVPLRTRFSRLAL